MLTYDLSETCRPLYLSLYEFIRRDIHSGLLSPGEKMPSKRAFASNLGVSTITIEKAYDQLISEGYMYSLPKKGYFITSASEMKHLSAAPGRRLNISLPPAPEEYRFDFSANITRADNFPTSIWSRLTREIISMREHELLTVPPCSGALILRQAIAGHLSDFRGMNVDPDQIVIGSGTEYLYGMLVRLLGRNRIYCVENPGYSKLRRIYESDQVRCVLADMDNSGIYLRDVRRYKADVVHISPNHHFPTGITMPLSRRTELLSWACEADNRYIIEDDYDSEFRIKGKPLPTLQSIDTNEKVIYMNTFSKSLASTIRISYMVLPEHLINRYYRELSFFSCTVPTLEQYTLAEFISRGFFEKHINRMRLSYGRQRQQILCMIRNAFTEDECRIIENDSGLHFIMELSTSRSDSALKASLAEYGIHLAAVSDFYTGPVPDDDHSNPKADSCSHRFLLNYSSMDISMLPEVLDILRSKL